MFLSTDPADYSQLTDSYPKDESIFEISEMLDKIKESAETYYDMGDPEKNQMLSKFNTTHTYPDGSIVF